MLEFHLGVSVPSTQTASPSDMAPTHREVDGQSHQRRRDRRDPSQGTSLEEPGVVKGCSHGQCSKPDNWVRRSLRKGGIACQLRIQHQVGYAERQMSHHGT